MGHSASKTSKSSSRHLRGSATTPTGDLAEAAVVTDLERPASSILRHGIKMDDKAHTSDFLRRVSSFPRTTSSSRSKSKSSKSKSIPKPIKCKSVPLKERSGRGRPIVFHGDSVTTSKSSLHKPSVSFLRSELPDILQPYANSIHIVHYFWSSFVQPLSDEPSKKSEYKMMSMLLYANLFKRLPEARELFISRDATAQAEYYMNTIGYFINSLVTSTVHVEKLMKKLTKYGKEYSEWIVDGDRLELLLEAFHDTFQERFMKEYSFFVRFSFSQLFKVGCLVMRGEEPTAIDVHKADCMEYLKSFDACLSHPIGCIHLESFMRQQFCGELMDFLVMFRKFKGAFLLERVRWGKKIMDEFISAESATQINISHPVINAILIELSLEPGCYPPYLFDAAATQVKRLAKRNCWTDFQNAMAELSGCTAELEEWRNKVREERIARGKARREALKKKSMLTLTRSRTSVSLDSLALACDEHSAPKSLIELLGSRMKSVSRPDKDFCAKDTDFF